MTEYLFVGYRSLLKFLEEIPNLGIREVFIETSEVEHPPCGEEEFSYERLLLIQGVEYEKKLVHYCLIRLDFIPLKWNREGIFGESKEQIKYRFDNRCDTARENVEIFCIKLGIRCRPGSIAMPKELGYFRAEPFPLKLIPDQHAFHIEF